MSTSAETEQKTPEADEAAERNGGEASPAGYVLLTIALIAVICLSVGLALAFGGAAMTSGQRWFLSGFLGLFSVFSVGIVIWLVLRQARRLAFAESDPDISWRTTSPEKQKRRLNLEVKEIGEILHVDDDHLAELRAAYIVAEDLALRSIQNQAGKPLMRKVTLGSADFDAVLLDGDLAVLISVIFLLRPVVPDEKIKRLFREAQAASKAVGEIRPGSRTRLLLLLVTQLDGKDEAKLRSTVADSFKSTPVDVDIRWMDFQNLQGVYSDG